MPHHPMTKTTVVVIELVGNPLGIIPPAPAFPPPPPPRNVAIAIVNQSKIEKEKKNSVFGSTFLAHQHLATRIFSITKYKSLSNQINLFILFILVFSNLLSKAFFILYSFLSCNPKTFFRFVLFYLLFLIIYYNATQMAIFNTGLCWTFDYCPSKNVHICLGRCLFYHLFWNY